MFKSLIAVLLSSCFTLTAITPAYAALSPYSLQFNIGTGELNKYQKGNSPRGILPPDGYSQTSNATETMIDVSVARHFNTSGKYFSHYQVGLDYNFNVSAQQIKGEINEFGLSQFNNYNYDYDIQRRTLLANFSADIYHGKVLSPYVLAGIGVSINRITGFNAMAKPNIGPVRIDLDFANKTTTSFAYQAGLGLRYQTNAHTSLALSYRYLDAGKAKLGANRFSVTGPNTKLRYNIIMFGMDYRA